MPESLRIEAGSARGVRKKLKLTKLSEAGAIVAQLEELVDSSDHFRKVSRSLGISEAVLQAAVARFRESGAGDTPLEQAAPVAQASPPVMFRLRGIKQKAAEGSQHDSFEGALRAPGPAGETVIEWRGTEEVCGLDLDFHAGFAPDAADLNSAVSILAPIPFAWWISAHGGLRSMYRRMGGYTAEQLAGVAGLALLLRFPAATLELKSRTRRPQGEAVLCEQSAEVNSLRRLFADTEADEEGFADWLEERGYTPGERYTHDQCPVAPSARGERNTPPVCIYDNHIYCYICASDGVKRGSNTAGYFPLAALAGSQVPTMVKLCVRRLTHWGHAKHVLIPLTRNEKVARVVYSAALRMYHKADPRLDRIFSAEGPGGLVRYDGYWADGKGQTLTLSTASASLKDLPAARYLNANGEEKAHAATVERLAQPADITPYGYPALCPVWGMQLTFLQEQPATKIFSVVQSKLLNPEQYRDRRPRYVSKEKRMPEAEAWGVLSRAFPGVQPAAIKLLIVAKGCAEMRAGLPPMVFLTGPTGSGKTVSPLLAAAICGDSVATVRYTVNEERLRQGLHSAKQTGSYAFFDEYLKAAAAAKQSPVAAMEVLLGFTEDSLSHKLYTGPVALGDLPACVWADTAIHKDILTHAQIGRRVFHIGLPDEQHWEDTCAAEGIEGPKKLRLALSRRYADAADAILSAVVDEWFGPGPPTDFANVAVKLGFKRIRDGELAEEKKAAIRDLFKRICDEPALTGSDRIRWKGPGWKLVQLSGTSDLTEAWLALQPGNEVASTNIFTETDLRQVIGLAYVTAIDVDKHGNKLAVRFINRETGRTNRELYGNVELGAAGSSPNGLGNPIDSGPTQDWGASLPPGFLNPVAQRCVLAPRSLDGMDSDQPGAGRAGESQESDRVDNP